MENPFDLEKYAACARRVCAEGAVLLRNENGALPLEKGSSVAGFGRSQMNYYKSGTGSGGLVNVAHVTDIWEALAESGLYELDWTLREEYEVWTEEHPYDKGKGWGDEPWFQAEMPLDPERVERAAEHSDAALILLGRTAGEDQDNRPEPGSYYLTEGERDLLKQVCGTFSRTIVLLNVGNLIDMGWVEEYRPDAVMYVWQGGEQGGNGVLDVLSGAVSPSGKLTDTVPISLNRNPVRNHDGDPDRNFYAEDLYLGYRYFETFDREGVLYPFGFGLSYTGFSVATETVAETDRAIEFLICVTNTGAVSGREVVQLYVEKPQGVLGQPLRQLCGYRKTGLLAPGASETVKISLDWNSLSSYDDSGATGHRSCYVLESGEYRFYVGTDVRSAGLGWTAHREKLTVTARLEEAMAPVTPFRRLRPGRNMETVYEDVPLRTVEPATRRRERLPSEISQTGDAGHRLSDVVAGKVSMDAFVAQLSDEDLCAIVRGEGMCSPRVTPGTGGAFGGVTERLQDYGIPAACCSDGPSGIRMDCGTKAFSLPNGTCMACTFDDGLIEELYAWEGMELRKNKIDMLLGPGMNLHRSPLCGRNFEYFSEDPLLSGKMAASQLRGMGRHGVIGVIKHFACNNQEYRRNFAEAVVSERALRELYLKGFEIAVKEGGAFAVMSTYGPVNGVYTSSHYDLLTTILRGEWGFDGIVMTDWWARGGEGISDGSRRHTACMVRAQNDLSMVTSDAAGNADRDDTMDGLQTGVITRGELQRCAANICRAILRLPVFQRSLGTETALDRALAAFQNREDAELSEARVIRITDGQGSLPLDAIHAGAGETTLYQVFTTPRGSYRLSISCRAEAESPLAQMPVTVFYGTDLIGTILLTGRDRTERTFDFTLPPAFLGSNYLKLFFGQSGIVISKAELHVIEDMEQQIREMMEKSHG